MAIYSEGIIKKVQNCIDKKNYECKNFESFSDLPIAIYALGIKIVRRQSDGENYTKETEAYYDMGAGVELKNEISASGLFTFFGKDWKKDNDGDFARLYKELTFDIGNGIVVVSLVRKLNESEVIKVTKRRNEKRQIETIETCMQDLVIDNEPYTIIKMFVNEYENYTSSSDLEDYNKIDTEINYLLKNYGSSLGDDDSSDDGGDDNDISNDSEILF